MTDSKMMAAYPYDTTGDVAYIRADLAHPAPVADAELEALIEALTPSGDTKAAYMGEFSFYQAYTDDEGDEALGKVDVPWDTIKQIMATIRSRAALRARTAQPVGVRVKPWDTRPQGPDAMLPSTVDVYEGSWAAVIGTNGKPAGWVDTHDLFADQLYRDRIRSALLPEGGA